MISTYTFKNKNRIVDVVEFRALVFYRLCVKTGPLKCRKKLKWSISEFF